MRKEMNAEQGMKAIRRAGRKEKARHLSAFFKTGKGQYGEGDIFLGVTVPEARKIARRFLLLPLPEVKKLLKSPYHEERFLALIILVEKFRSAGGCGKVFRFYISNKKCVNNWDLVDISAPVIAGEWLRDGKGSVSMLYELARSESLWDRRMAIVATFAFIKSGNPGHTFELSKRLLKDREDLMHKACGWMLREAGKRDKKALMGFLDRYGSKMPRTMLRYAIERFSETERMAYMNPRKFGKEMKNKRS